MEGGLDRFEILFLASVIFCHANGIYIFREQNTIWPVAKKDCEDSGMKLAVISDQQKLEELLAWDSQHGGIIFQTDVWIGFYTESSSCTGYTWVDGTLVSWANWDYGEPNNCQIEFYGRLSRGKMRNTPNSRELQYICEFQQDATSMVTEENSESPIGSAGGTTYTTSVTTGTTGHTTEYTHVNDDGTDDTTTELDLTTLPTTSAMAEKAELTTFGPDIATANASSNVINDKEKMTTASVNATLLLTNDDSSCLCRIDQDSTVPLQGIIPNSSAHRNIMLAAGYVPACPGKIQWGNMSLSLKEDQKLALINALKKELTVAKKSTSLYRRKRISAQDTRPSSVSVGSLGICLFIGFFGIVVAIDASRLYSHVAQRKGKHQ